MVGRRLHVGPGLLQHDRIVAPLADHPRATQQGEYPDRLYALSVITPPERRDELEEDGWVVHEDPTRAVTAIAAMGRFGAAFHAGRGPPPGVGQVMLPAETPSEAEANVFCVRRHPVRAGTGMRQLRGRGRGGGTVRFPGRDEDPVARYRAQIRNRRRAAECHDDAAVREGYDLLLSRAKRAAPRARSRACWWRSNCKAGSSASSASTATRCSDRSRCSVSAASSSR